MKLFLFGGAELGMGEVQPELRLIEQVIKESGTKQVLLIPFARNTLSREVERNGDYYNRYIHLPEVEYLNARNPEDMKKVKSPLILIMGGSESQNLIERVQPDKQLMDLINQAEYIIGESGGARILGEYAYVRNRDSERKIVPGLGIIKNTIIEPHYTQQNRQQTLEERMQETGVKYGLGIDTVTAMVFDTETFPDKYETIGDGIVEVKVNPNAKN